MGSGQGLPPEGPAGYVPPARPAPPRRSGFATVVIAALVLAILAAAAFGYWWFRGRASSTVSSRPGHADLAAAIAKMSPDEKQAAYQGEVETLQSHKTQLQQYVDSFPRTLTDVDALAQSFSTPQAAFEFVRDQIALEPYPGELKGPLGTLLTRGGNDLDRSLLLAALLKTQSVSPEIAHGKISEAQAQTLLGQIAVGPDAVDQLARSLPAASSLAQTGSDNADDRKAFDDAVSLRRKELAATVDQTYEQIQSAMKSAGIALGHDATAQRLEALEDHYWVRATIDGKTVDLDPSIAGAQIGQSLTTPAETRDVDGVPDTVNQRLKFRVVAEHLQSGSLHATEVLSQEMQSVDLIGKNIRLTIEPQTTAPNVNRFRASLSVGDDTANGSAFTLRPGSAGKSSGDAADIAGQQSGDAGALGGGLGGLGGGGSSGTAGESTPAPAAKSQRKPASAESLSGRGEPVLVRLSLEVISTGPHLVETRYRRVIMDRLATVGGKPQLLPAFADDRSIRPLLVAAWDGAISVGPYQPAFAYQTEAETLADQEPLEEKLRGKFYLGEDVGNGDVPAPSLSPNLLAFFLSSDLARHGLRSKSATHSRSYYERPRLAFFRHGFAVRDWAKPGNTLRYLEGIDVINSPFGFLGATDESSAFAVKSGIADTFFERHFQAGGKSFNTLKLMEAAASSAKLVTVSPTQSGAIATISVPPPIQSALQQDIDSGHALLAPGGLVALNGSQQFGWWSIDPATGFTIGRMDIGGSQGFVERAEIDQRIDKWTQTFIKFYGNVIQCYLTALGDALGSVGTDDDLKATVTVNHGDDSPLPEAEKVTDCLLDAACDALADLVGEEFGEAASDEEMKGIEEVIWNLEKQKGVSAGIGKTGAKICTGLMKKAMGG